MIDQPAYVKLLLQKYFQGTATAVELARLMVAWDIYDDDELSAMIAEVSGKYNTGESAEEEKKQQAEEANETEPAVQGSLKKAVSWQNYIFGTLLLVFVASIIVVLMKQTTQPEQRFCDGLSVNTLLPTAPYHCSVVSVNGNRILVDSTKKGLIAVENDLTMLQPVPGLLVYQKQKNAKSKATPVYHTIQTEPGQQYRLLLPDGSQLRLNAASTIRFAVASKQQRILYLQGEALLDIVADSAAPFIVYTGNTVITVQQARLNIKAYAQQTVATLIKGKMNIKAGTDSVQLTNGNKATTVAAAMQVKPRMKLMKADTMAAVSWTKTTRIYNHASMREFVADIGRWYNLEFVNLTCIPAAAHISIVICANAPIEKLLEIFTDQKLKFFKVGNRITFCDPVTQPRPVSSTLPLASIQ